MYFATIDDSVSVKTGPFATFRVGADLAGDCQLHAQRDAPGRVARMIRSHDRSSEGRATHTFGGSRPGAV